METLLAIDPSKRSTAASALSSKFFQAKSYAYKPSNHRWMEMQKKLQANEKRRLPLEKLRANLDSDIKEKTSRSWPDGR
ncbi:hypothetical protein MKW98_006574 [Papaver atlanticum]|uniref:Uncharacterized protein n=1 Tax=Papaver atlanticum TaxID=357466 RepID=A0AAD4T9Q4_9MAGN|nr:hypothetical protein MKW98_006574 [Papaver atlanticum]